MFTKETPRETPEDGDRPLRKAKFDNFTYIEKNQLEDSSNGHYLDIN